MAVHLSPTETRVMATFVRSWPRPFNYQELRSTGMTYENLKTTVGRLRRRGLLDKIGGGQGHFVLMPAVFLELMRDETFAATVKRDNGK